ncbi:MAG TPA: hypothetical protein VFC85_09205 [Verrucomicrobiae bacterium]|nr:hypothetical protein [Verrucomicrobiae bacterium]
MFDLEKSTADWRRQMLAAGIKTPVPLEELENHLREDIERQMKAGLDEQDAFRSSVQKIGQRDILKMEFAKNGNSLFWFGETKATKTNQILGVLWFTQCTWFLIRYATSPVAAAIILCFPHYWQFLTVFFTLLSLTGVIGSRLLIRSAKSGTSIIRIIAVLEFLLCAFEYITGDGSFGSSNYWYGILSGFSFTTIWLLRSSKQKESKLAVE